MSEPRPERVPKVMSDEQTAVVWQAMMLAPSLELCKALLRGEDVPRGKLDQEWLKRFGRRRVA